MYSKDNIFTEEGKRNIVGFFDTLLKVYTRLVKEGKIKEGNFITPKKPYEKKISK